MADSFSVQKFDCIVIGAGPAGMMAAVCCADRGFSVVVLEKNQMIGKKLRITGKGRCNITNSCDFDTLLSNIPGNPKFLYSALRSFGNHDIIDFFNSEGLRTVEERGGRIFPESQKASDVAECLKSAAKKRGITVKYGINVERIILSDTDNADMAKKQVSGVVCDDGMKIYAPAVVVATGGVSYPLTGSTGSGYKWAKEAGHTVIPPKPSLCALVSDDKRIGGLEGLSLKNIGFCVKKNEKTVYDDFGELLFTSNGISGPVVLSASRTCVLCGFENMTAYIDLKPALSPEQLDARLLRDFSHYINKQMSNALADLLPHRMIGHILAVCGIPETKKVNEVSKKERGALVSALKALPVSLCGSAPIKEAIVTCGGVKVSEINPATMESKLCSGLFFAGEVIDVDGYTGGFNLTIAFSTGAAAGRNIKKNIAQL